MCGLILTLFGWLNLGSLALFTAIGCAGLRKPTQAIEEKASYYLAALLLLWAGLLLTDLYPSSFLSSKQGLWENFQAGALGGTFLIYSWTLWKIGSSRPLVPGLLLLIVLFGFLEETSWGTDWLSAKQSQTFSVHEAQWTPSIVDSFFAIGIPFSLLSVLQVIDTIPGLIAAIGLMYNIARTASVVATDSDTRRCRALGRRAGAVEGSARH